jgi:ankyrin repeat protein
MRRCLVAAIILCAGMDVAVVAQTSNGEATTASQGVGATELLTPVAQAVVHGDMNAVVTLVEKEPEVVNEAVRSKKGEKAGFTPIILAAAFSRFEIVKYLMSENADITKLDDYNRSVFWYAAFNGDIEVTQMVLAIAKPPVVTSVINIPDSDLMRTPLQLAVRRNEPQLVRMLVNAGASEAKDVWGETPIQFCKRNQTVGCNELLKLRGLK